MDAYIKQIKDRVINYNNELISRNNLINKLKGDINSYLNAQNFSYHDFITNKSIRIIIGNLVEDKKLVDNFNKAVSDLLQVDWIKLVSNLDKNVSVQKQTLLKSVSEVLGYLNKHEVNYYTNLDKTLEVLDNLGNSVVQIDKYFNKMLERLGLNSEEILELNAYVTKQNMIVYASTMKKIDDTALNNEEKAIESALKKETRKRKKHVFAKDKSVQATMLLEKADLLLKELDAYEKTDENMAIAYLDLLLNDVDTIVATSLDSKTLLKCLLINILDIRSYITKNESNFLESELSEKLDALKKLCENYELLKIKIMSQNNEVDLKYQDSSSTNKNMDEISVYYIYNSKTNKEYYEEDLINNKAAPNYVNNARNMVEKLLKGNYNLKNKKSVKGIPNCFYVQQGLTYLSFLMVSQKDYIIITSSKWDDLFRMTKNICESEQDQIKNLRNEITGDRK